MVQINGRLNGSITGLIRATADSPFIDSSTNPPTLVVNPYEANITNSQFTITLPQSQNLQGGEGITYKWELYETKTVVSYYLLDGSLFSGPVHQWATDGKWWTGSVHDTTSRLLDRVSQSQNIPIQEPFHAVAPDSPTPVPFTSLVGIPTQSPWFDIGIARILEQLTTNPTYLNRISAKFVIRGAYAANTIYQINDIVSFNGNSYAWINPTPAQNQAPPLTGNNANWFMIAAKGEAGGTGAQIVGYNSTIWTGNSEAAARGDVRDAIASIPNPDLSNYLTIAAGLPRNNPVMAGSAKRSTLTYPVGASDRASEIPTAQYIEDAIAASVGKFPRPIVFYQASSDTVVSSGGASAATATVFWDTTVLDPNAAFDGSIFTAPATGSYLFAISLFTQLRASNAYEPTKQIIRAFLRNQATAVEIGNFFLIEEPAKYSVDQKNQSMGMRYQHSLNAGTKLDIRVAMSITNGASIYNPGGDTPARVMGGIANNWLAIWRLG